MIELTWWELALVALAFYYVGRVSMFNKLLKNILNRPDYIKALVDRYHREKDQPQKDQPTVAVTVEWQGDQCYLYREDTMEFIGQGDSIEAAIQNSRIHGGVEYLIPADMAKKPETNQP